MKLKPCPFCGGKARFCEPEDGSLAGGVYIECSKCHVGSTVMFAEKCDARPLLAERWNCRMDEEKMRAAEAERDALAKFKTYVHKRLDEAGVPVDPDSPHKAAGCRIGGRLDWVLRWRYMRNEPLPKECGSVEVIWKPEGEHETARDVICEHDARMLAPRLVCWRPALPAPAPAAATEERKSDDEGRN